MTPDHASQAELRPASPLQLLGMFLYVGVTSLGGGLGAHIYTAIKRRGWTDDATYSEAFTLAQLLPGSNAGNLAAFLGMRLCGKLGSVVSVLGLLIPGSVVIALLTLFYFQHGSVLPGLVSSALKGASAAAFAVMVSAALPILKTGSLIKAGPWLILLTFVLLGLLRMDILLVLVTVLPIGLLVHRPRRESEDA
ncbi:chromate transporter [Deinococcus cellulosilyticus]|uniref:Chromate transporter n=1 Tax=Deinococcus cellulosilyticus (strain DSM 18568 / NBRC 106333 / KACC 11606 / 5516J-15) TaxID=1223518 RepID=A0A511MW09_DEIC1|nr:chromate transporter [Deinococcus cellulosilyticus]GEM44762.1 hypothetical protein DC3_03970 [Deinococcus cellulosilyticus NBRC 106333 = KACC 11606]